MNFGPQKVLLARIEPPKWIFFGGDYISAPRGCCALKFIHALEIAQALIAHTRSGTGVSPKNFNGENIKFALKFSVLATITSGLVGISSPIFSRRRDELLVHKQKSYSAHIDLPKLHVHCKLAQVHTPRGSMIPFK